MRAPAHTDRRTGRIVRHLVLAWLAVMVVACGGSAAQAPVGGAARAGSQAAAAGSNAPGTQTGGDGGSQTGDNGNPAAPVDDTKIVRTGSLQLSVADTDEALVAGRDAIRGLGGYIGSSQQQRSNDKVFATVTYRIPVARWEDALDAIRHLGTEVAEQTDAAEVTGQLVDLDARIRNLKASEAALVGYAANAPKISDLLEIESRLTDTRGEIERMTAEQAALSDKAAMATLTVTFGTDVVAVADAAARWDPAAEVDRASAMLIGVGQAIASFLILFTIVWLPILICLAVVGYVGLRMARRLGWQRPGAFPPIDAGPPPPPPAPAPPVSGA